MSGSSVSSSDRDSSGATTAKNGFSVVAATSVTKPFSTAGNSASCWVLVKRWTSSMNSTVRTPDIASASRASSIAARTSFTPAVTADNSRNRRPPEPAMTWARVVLPVPGGPHSRTEVVPPPSARRRSGLPGPSR